MKQCECVMSERLTLIHMMTKSMCPGVKPGFATGRWLVFLALLLSLAVVQGAEPLRALLITGGCCHDYEAQKKTLTEGIIARANVTWTILHEGTKDSKE